MELALAMAGVILTSALLVGWFVTVNGVEAAQGDADTAARQAVVARERITRDLRRARALTTASATEIAIWLDDDGDAVTDPGEQVYWQIIPGGALVRSSDGIDLVVADAVDSLRSSFSFDADEAALVGRVDVLVTIESGGSTRMVEVSIHLRNTRDYL